MFVLLREESKASRFPISLLIFPASAEIFSFMNSVSTTFSFYSSILVSSLNEASLYPQQHFYPSWHLDADLSCLFLLFDADPSLHIDAYPSLLREVWLYIFCWISS